MASPTVDPAVLDRALMSIGTITYQQRDLNLYKMYETDILAGINEYLAKNREYREFVGPTELVTDVQQVAIDAPRNGFWKDSDTTDWRQTPTGIGTFDNVYPEAASAAIQLSTPPPHWLLMFGVLEIGSANNLISLNLARINGKIRGISSCQNFTRLGALKAKRFAKGLIFKERGDFNIDAEFETTATTEVYPYGVHILPGEIAKSTAPAGFVTTISA